MADSIGKFSAKFNVWGEKTIQKLAQAQAKVAKNIQDDVKAGAPIRSGAYQSSIKVSETKINNGVITTEVYSDLLVGGTNPKWAKVPLGCLLEWGTGIKGLSSNTFPHGYGYRLTPWTYYDEYLHMFVTTDGMVARQHFHTALMKNKPNYKRMIRKAMK